MTAYQRGNRDGLLAFATWCDAQAEAAREQEAWWSTKYGLSAQRTVDVESGRASAFAEAAQQARKAAEALPEDPEEPVVPPVLAGGLRFPPVRNDGTGDAAHRVVEALRNAGWSGWFCENDGGAWTLQPLGGILPVRVPVGSRVSMRVDGRLWVGP